MKQCSQFMQLCLAGSCSGPTVGLLEKCSIIEPGEQWKNTVSAYLSEVSDGNRVEEMTYILPKGMSYTEDIPPPGRFVQSTISFQTRKLGIYEYTITATDDFGLQGKSVSGKVIVKDDEAVLPPPTPQILPTESYPATNSQLNETVEHWYIMFDGPITRPDSSSYIMVMDGKNRVYASYDAANPNEVEFPADDPMKARYKAPKDLEVGKTYMIYIEKDFSVQTFSIDCLIATSCSSTMVYFFSIRPFEEDKRPKIELEECSVIAPGETWNSFVIASINLQTGSNASGITEIQGSYPSGMKMSYVKDLEPGKGVVKSKLSFKSEKEGTYVFSFTATDDNGIQSNQKSGYLIVSAGGIPMNTDLKSPVLLPDQSTPARNSSYEGRETFWTIKFDSNITSSGWKSYIKIHDMNTAEVIAKYNALDNDVVRFPDNDPTIVQYLAPTRIQGGKKTYLVNVDTGFVARILSTPCGRSAKAVNEGARYTFQISNRPEVECGDSYIKVRIPKTYVNNIPASELHLHDTRCRIKDNGDPMYYQIKFAYDECGTNIEHLLSTTNFYNTIRDDPKPIVSGAPITREKHKVDIQIICKMKGVGEVFFQAAASTNPEKYQASGKFKTYLKMYEDSSYNIEINGTASVELNEQLYFAAHHSTSKEVAIESCRAMAKFGTCTENDKKYTFIENGCAVDSSVILSSSGLDHRFTIQSFGFLQYGISNEVFVKCKIVSCKPGSNSRCADLKSGSCSRRQRDASFEEESDTFMNFIMP